jgi:hypothetical protein
MLKVVGFFDTHAGLDYLGKKLVDCQNILPSHVLRDVGEELV